MTVEVEVNLAPAVVGPLRAWSIPGLHPAVQVSFDRHRGEETECKRPTIGNGEAELKGRVDYEAIVPTPGAR